MVAGRIYRRNAAIGGIQLYPLEGRFVFIFYFLACILLDNGGQAGETGGLYRIMRGVFAAGGILPVRSLGAGGVYCLQSAVLCVVSALAMAQDVVEYIVGLVRGDFGRIDCRKSARDAGHLENFL